MNKRISLQQIILETLYRQENSIASGALVPMALKILLHIDPNAESRSVKPEYVLRRTLNRLQERGYIDVAENDNKIFFRLTPTGRKKLNLAVDFKVHQPTQVRRWDGKWHVIILDLAEDQKSARDRIRTVLKSMGFKPLKNSIWIHQHNCQDLVHSIRKTFGLQSEIIYIVADSLDTVN